ncbi:hypothetical protein SAMN05444389_102146 [Paracoccus solventivorans]|uniref:Uncharacterized protein n=1 Tax=Paracoccus solventivorans TaxID=53463 RepID=A0A1M7EJ04_9RHOB|nr:hypothetical protein [Paracoccus solventivorans]SHL91815.1 hypothetical protein SAMN05444389_102146 [Paracoccus solventivorans]
MTNCARNCWIFAAVMGLVVLLFSLGGVGFMGGLFLGFVTAWLLGGLGMFLLCQGAEADESWVPVEDARDPDEPVRQSIRRDGGAAAQVAIARPQRPAGMAGAPAEASVGGGQAVTFEPGKGGATKAKPAPRRKAARALAADGDSAHAPAGGDAAGSGGTT